MRRGSICRFILAEPGVTLTRLTASVVACDENGEVAGDVTTELHMTRIDDDVRAVVDTRHMHRGLAHWRAPIEGRSVVCGHLHVRPACR